MLILHIEPIGILVFHETVNCELYSKPLGWGGLVGSAIKSKKHFVETFPYYYVCMQCMLAVAQYYQHRRPLKEENTLNINIQLYATCCSGLH